MTKYNHAMTIAFEVISDQPEQPTLDEIYAGLLAKMEEIRVDEGERYEALMVDLPFDTYEIIEDDDNE